MTSRHRGRQVGRPIVKMRTPCSFWFRLVNFLTYFLRIYYEYLNNNEFNDLIQVGCTADDSLTTSILTLLKIAIDGVPFDSKSESTMSRMSEDEKSLKSLAHQVLDTVEKRTFLEFVKKYLLEHSVLSTRWQAHSLMLGFFNTSDCSHQLKLVNTMWELCKFRIFCFRFY